MSDADRIIAAINNLTKLVYVTGKVLVQCIGKVDINVQDYISTVYGENISPYGTQPEN